MLAGMLEVDILNIIRIAFGRPVIAGTRIPTAEVAERFNAGDHHQHIHWALPQGMRQVPLHSHPPAAFRTSSFPNNCFFPFVAPSSCVKRHNAMRPIVGHAARLPLPGAGGERHGDTGEEQEHRCGHRGVRPVAGRSISRSAAYDSTALRENGSGW